MTITVFIFSPDYRGGLQVLCSMTCESIAEALTAMTNLRAQGFRCQSRIA